MSSPASAHDPDTAAIVLAGGASRRMGRPKPFLRVGNAELLERALRTAAAVCPTVLLVGADADVCRRAAIRYGWRPDRESQPGTERRSEADTGRRSGASMQRTADAGIHLRRGSCRLVVLTDRRPGHGPLAGLESAWSRRPAGTRRFWALAPDLPFVSPALGRRLLAEFRAWEMASEEGARAVVAAATGHRQPLCAAYGAGALGLVPACLDREVRALHAFLERLHVRTLELAPGEGWRLFNVNTDKELREARARARGEEERRGGG